MAWRPLSFWLRFRVWLAKRLGLWRGTWQRGETEANVARWTWWPWPFGERRWRYAVYTPPGLAGGEAAPLVVLLHGCRQHAMEFAHASGWVQAAARERFRLLCPEQRDGANPFRCWNWFHPPAQGGHGELDVVLQALDESRQRHATSQVVAVGLSAGGALAALLAFHHAERLAGAVVVAGLPLLGRANLQDPRQVMRHGLALRPTLAAHGLRHCAPLLIVQGADDEVVNPLCAQQLAEQACHVLAREHAALQEQRLADGVQWCEGPRPLLRHLLLPGLGHAWSGGPGGHDYTPPGGPPLVALALDFLRAAGALVRQPAAPWSDGRNH